METEKEADVMKIRVLYSSYNKLTANLYRERQKSAKIIYVRFQSASKHSMMNVTFIEKMLKHSIKE